jgi:hypothetical protein
MWRLYIIFALPLMVAGCASEDARRAMGTGAAAPYDLPPPTQCAIFAREISGIPLRGDAWTWWDQADGRWQRDPRPEQDAILVLRATDRLPHGHVAIVRRVVGPREITVTHANWGNDDPTRRLVHDSMAVVDVSAANDWSLLRFWNPAAQTFGRPYEAYGFIHPRGATRDLQPVW